MVEVIQFFVWSCLHVLPVAIWLVVAFYVWQLLHTMQAFFVGTVSLFMCRQWLLPFRHVYETLRWHLPGGTERMVAFVQHHTARTMDGRTTGRTQTWCHTEVHLNKLYLECARDILPRKVDILITHVAILFWPLVMLVLVLLLPFERGRTLLFQSGIMSEFL